MYTSFSKPYSFVVQQSSCKQNGNWILDFCMRVVPQGMKDIVYKTSQSNLTVKIPTCRTIHPTDMYKFT